MNNKLMMLLVGMFSVTLRLLATEPSVPFLEPQFDDKGRLQGMKEASCQKYTLLDQNYRGAAPCELTEGWYVVSNEHKSVTFPDGVTVNGDVHLIVCDGQTMKSDQSASTVSRAGIEVQGKGSLTIYAQSPDTNVMGRVVACGGANHAGIEGLSASHITINGGLIEATGGSSAAGIGGGQNQNGENITINGGYVHATGGQLGAGIGGGEKGNGCFITVNGGTVDAKNLGGNGKRIGGGDGGSSANVVFMGGCIVSGANPTPVDANGHNVYEVILPDSTSEQMPCGKFTGACTVTFTNNFGYYAKDVYPLDRGRLFFYLPSGDYEVSILDASQAVKRYRINVQGGPGKVERIYDYITFESDAGFSLKTANDTKNWDSYMLWSHDLIKWYVWEGEEISSASTEGCHRLYVRGTANTYVCREKEERWILTSSQTEGRISCYGNLETLRGGAEDAPAPASMAKNAFAHLFFDCEALLSTPLMPATNLTTGCYAYMFERCRSLVEPANLPATVLPANCYRGMFRGCTGILLNQYRKGKIWMIPQEAKGDTDWNKDMFADTGYFFMGDPDIGKEYYISFLTLVNPANPPRYNNWRETTNGIATSFVIWPNQDVRAAQPNPYAYNNYFWVTNVFDADSSMHVLDVRMTEVTSNAVLTSIHAAMPDLVKTVTNKVPYTTVYAVPGIYYGIAGSTNLFDVALNPQVPANTWTVGRYAPEGTRIDGLHPDWPSDRAFYRIKASILPK